MQAVTTDAHKFHFSDSIRPQNSIAKSVIFIILIIILYYYYFDNNYNLLYKLLYISTQFHPICDSTQKMCSQLLKLVIATASQQNMPLSFHVNYFPFWLVTTFMQMLTYK